MEGNCKFGAYKPATAGSILELGNELPLMAKSDQYTFKRRIAGAECILKERRPS